MSADAFDIDALEADVRKHDPFQAFAIMPDDLLFLIAAVHRLRKDALAHTFDREMTAALNRKESIK